MISKNTDPSSIYSGSFSSKVLMIKVYKKGQVIRDLPGCICMNTHWFPLENTCANAEVDAENLTCSISMPNNIRSRLSWNELTELQHRQKTVSSLLSNLYLRPP